MPPNKKNEDDFCWLTLELHVCDECLGRHASTDSPFDLCTCSVGAVLHHVLLNIWESSLELLAVWGVQNGKQTKSMCTAESRVSMRSGFVIWCEWYTFLRKVLSLMYLARSWKVMMLKH